MTRVNIFLATLLVLFRERPVAFDGEVLVWSECWMNYEYLETADCASRHELRTNQILFIAKLDPPPRKPFQFDI